MIVKRSKKENSKAEGARVEARWTRRKDARPAELLAAALDLFVERGYAGTRLDDVASRAGVSKGTLYLYYSSKEELFKAVIREGLVPVYEHGERMVDAHTGSAEDLIRNLLREWWEMVGATNLGGIPKLMIAESGNFPDVTRYYFDEVVSRGRKLVARAVQLRHRRRRVPRSSGGPDRAPDARAGHADGDLALFLRVLRHRAARPRQLPEAARGRAPQRPAPGSGREVAA